MVPNGWMTATLGDLVNKSAFGPRFTSELYAKDGAIGTIRTTDLYNEGEINYATIPYANLDTSEYEEHILKEGDLLITRSGTCGIPCIFTKQEKPIIAGAFLIRFQLNNKIDSKFLHEALKSSPIQSDIKRMAAGGVQKNLTGTSLKKLSMLVPPLPEQRKIAQILSTWDRGIATTKKLIDASKQQKKALMQQLLTGKKRLIDPETGKAFEGDWETKELRELVTFVNGKGHEKNIIDEGKYIVVNSKFISSDGRVYKQTNDAFCPALIDDILMVMSDVPNGKAIAKCFLVNENNKFTVNQRIARFRSKSCNSTFLFYSINRNSYYLEFDDGLKQTNLRKDDVLDCPLKIPPIQEQQKIASVLTAADKEIELLVAKLAHLKQEKKALMQQLLTGKRRVSLSS